MEKYRIDDLYIGQYYETEFCIAEETGLKFAEVSGDYNPIHLSEKIAEKSRFGRRIVHGMLIGSYFSGIIGSRFPEEGSVYINQKIFFKRPVYYNVYIKIRIIIIDIDRVKKHVLLKTECLDTDGKLLVDGDAEILFEG